MTWAAPLSISVDARPPSWILDLRLALSPYGLMLALRLAEESPVWLLRGLWAVLDGNPLVPVLSREGASDGGGEFQEDTRPAAEILSTWHEARFVIAAGGPRQLYWAGDVAHESRLPKTVDAVLVDRLDALAEGLQRRSGIDPLREPGPAPWEDTDAEALALAAAFGSPAAIVLTEIPPGVQSPALCESLTRAGVPCSRLEDRERLRVWRAALEPILLRAGVHGLLCGTPNRLAALHIAAPGAVIQPVSAEGPPPVPELATPNSQAAALWDWSFAFWHLL